MAGVSLSTVPEVLLTVAEKALHSRPLFLGLSGAQLSRLARELYVHLKNSGKDALAEQAKVLADPEVVVKAFQLLQPQSRQQPPPQGQGAPPAAASCPCCIHHNSCGFIQRVAAQPHIVPIVVQQQPQPWLTQQQLPQQLIAESQQHPQQQYMQQGQEQQQQEHSQLQIGEEIAVANPQRPAEGHQQEQQQSTSRKACVARLLFAVIAAKVARDTLKHYRDISGRKRNTSEDAAAVSGLGAPSLEGLAESLSPRRGLFAGLHQDLLLSLQRVVEAAIDGATAAAGVVGFRPSRDKSQGETQELPPLYLSPAEQGRVELTEHEKQASEIIERLLNMQGGRSIESLRREAEGQRQHESQSTTTGSSLLLKRGTKTAANETNECDALDAAFKEAWQACNTMSALEAKREYVDKARELEKLQARL